MAEDGERRSEYLACSLIQLNLSQPLLSILSSRFSLDSEKGHKLLLGLRVRSFVLCIRRKWDQMLFRL